MIEAHLVVSGDALHGQRPLNAMSGGCRHTSIQHALSAEESVPVRWSQGLRLAHQADPLVDAAGVGLLPLHADKWRPFYGIV